ncbi:HD-GYP domain-containing protein [Christensenellaceae bacterium OttesenSCG-928-M15]|nr:HD-GYP domain-containing protein [Christensenellaceae bacterium OttesenSCG-928-M15]
MLPQWLFQKNLTYIPSFPAMIGGAACYLIVVLFNFAGAERDWNIRMMPTEELLLLGKNIAAGKQADFSQYLLALGGNLEKSTKMRILYPDVSAKTPEFAAMMARHPALEAPEEGFVVLQSGKGVKGRELVIALPRFDAQAQTHYTVLRMTGHVEESTVKSVVMLIVSTAVYFLAAEESRKRQQLFYEMIHCMVSAIDAKDPVTAGHSQRVSKITADIAADMGLAPELVENLRFAGLIHDIGKIGVEDHILNKPGIFSASEFARMQEHPEKGHSIMTPVDVPSVVLEGILEHHERMDGRGYPHGKKGDEISLAGRIIKVADVYDALISERQYKKPWPLERVCAVLYEGRGTEFDEVAVDLLLQRIQPNGFAPPPQQKRERQAANPLYEQGLELARGLLSRAKRQKGAPMLRGCCTADITPGARDGFCGLEWGEGLQSREWMRWNADLLECDEHGEHMLYACRAQDESYGNIYFDFLRGFLCAGVLELSAAKPDKGLGAPASMLENGIPVFDTGRVLVYYIENHAGFPPVLCYISKYLCDEK